VNVKIAIELGRDRYFVARCLSVKSCFLILFVAFLTSQTGRATQLFPWGNSNILAQFAATNSSNIVVGCNQSNVLVSEAAFSHDVSFENLVDFNTKFQQVLSFAVNFALTNPAVDKTSPITIGGYSYNLNYPPGPNGAWAPYDVPWDPAPSIAFINEGNGTWAVPDLSWISMIFPGQMVFYTPGLLWGRIEVYYSTNTVTPVFVADSRCSNASSPTNDVNVDITNQSLTLDTTLVSGGSNGLYRLKVSLYSSNGFQIVNGNGVQVQETSLVPVISESNGTVNIKVTGGDSGRVFVIQKSSDLEAWIQVGGPYTVGTSPWSIMFQDATSNRFEFYRTATTNAVPQ
jgi:hypothetical protein